MNKALIAIAVASQLVWGLEPASAEDASVQAADQQAKSESSLHHISFGAFLGGFFGSKEHEFYNPQEAERVELNAAVLELGLRVGYSPISYVGVEAEGELIMQNQSRGDATIIGFSGHVIGQYPIELKSGSNLTPFAVAGLGTMAVRSDNAVLGNDADLVGYLGLGAKFDLSHNAIVRGDLRVIGAPEANQYQGRTAHTELLIGFSYDFSLLGDKAIETPPAESTE